MITSIIAPRLDYVHFIHALCLCFIASFAFRTYRDRNGLQWLWLSLFGASLGISLSIFLVAGTMVEAMLLKSLGGSFQSLAFFFLGLFGLHCLAEGRLRGLGYALVSVIAVLPAGCAIAWGTPGFELAVRLGLAPVSGCLALGGLVKMVRREDLGDSFVSSLFPLMMIYVAVLAIAPAVHVVFVLLAGGNPSDTMAAHDAWYSVAFACLAAAITAAYGRSYAARKGETGTGGVVAYAYGMTAVGLAVFLGFPLTETMGSSTEDSVKGELFMRVAAVGNALYADEVRGMKKAPAGIQSEEYRQLLRQLTKIRISNPDLKFVYMVDMETGSRKIKFLLDTEPPTSEDYAVPGTYYDEAPEELKTIYSSGKTTLVGPYSDRWGTWISGFAPVKDEVGAIIGVVGMDIYASKLKAQIATMRFTGIVITFLLAIIGAGIGLVVQRNRKLALANRLLSDEVDFRKRTERELTDARVAAEDANSAKTDFLTRMSHEIRTPMSVILGIGEMLEEEKLPDEQQEMVKVFRTAGEALSELIDDILDLSKVEAGQVTLERVEFRMTEFVDRLRTLMMHRAKEQGLTLEFRLSARTPDVLVGDPFHLRQVLINLLGNAIKFTPEGAVTLEIRPGRGKEAGEEVVEMLFSVRDTGIGIAEDQQGRIFERFTQADVSTTRKFGGTGLGLTICKKIVEMMGGDIWVDSAEGIGSTFSFTIPLEVGPLKDGAPVPDPQHAQVARTLLDGDAAKPGRILVVEDSESLQTLFALFMKNSPHAVDYAMDGQEGVDMFMSGKYDIVFMDVEMPVMDGWEAAMHMRAHEKAQDNGQVPIVMLTAHCFKGIEELGQKHGCTDFLSKPLKKGVLLAKVAEYLSM